MIGEDFIEFFIGGNIQEPVAIEIPLYNGGNSVRTELLEFLEYHGLTIDTREGNLQCISVTGETKRFGKPYFSIITPALDPNDLKKTYKILEELLEKFNKEKNRIKILYPHVLDLNNLVTQKQSSSTKTDITDIIERCIKKAEESDNVIKCKDIFELQRKIYEKDPDSKNGCIFGGSAMSDPYTVATTMYARYFRYASDDVCGAALYSGVFNFVKTNVDNNFCNILPNRKPVGFLHQYKKRSPEQKLFPDQSIEGGTGVANQQETMVNRFNNPVAATYVLWEDSSGNICAFKIPDNDADWAVFKEYYAASFYEKDTVKREKIAAWKKEKEHKAYTADDIFGLDWEERLKKLNKEEEERKKAIEEQKEAEEKLKKAIEEQLSDISNGIKGVSTSVKRPFFDARYSISYGKGYDEIYEHCKKFINESKECIEKYNGFIAELDKYQKELDSLKDSLKDLLTDSLKEKYQNSLVFYQGEINKKKNEIHKEITKLKADITPKEELQKEAIEKMAMVPNAISDRLDMDGKGRILDFAILKYVSRPLVEETAKKLAGVIFKIYNSLSAEEKGMLQEKFEEIKNKSSKQVLKQLKQIGKDERNDEFRSLFEIQKSLKDIFEAGIKKIFNREITETVRRKESANSRR